MFENIDQKCCLCFVTLKKDEKDVEKSEKLESFIFELLQVVKVLQFLATQVALFMKLNINFLFHLKIFTAELFSIALELQL